MKLIRPSTEILSITPEPLRLIELAGRTCYKSEEKISLTSHLDFVRMILKRGHESVLEHASATVRFICDRGVSHEIVRHRLAAYSQESTRYCDYEGGEVAFIIPSWADIKEGIYDELTGLSLRADAEWVLAMLRSEVHYKELREQGWRPEQSRSVLPNSLKTEIVMTANFREWRHFFKLRTSAAAHPQMREVAVPLLGKFMKQVPIVFDGLI